MQIECRFKAARLQLYYRFYAAAIELEFCSSEAAPLFAVGKLQLIFLAHTPTHILWLVLL